jgi:hypothetical protein
MRPVVLFTGVVFVHYKFIIGDKGKVVPVLN